MPTASQDTGAAAEHQAVVPHSLSEGTEYPSLGSFCVVRCAEIEGPSLGNGDPGDVPASPWCCRCMVLLVMFGAHWPYPSGPATVSSFRLDSPLPSPAQIAPWVPQSFRQDGVVISLAVTEAAPEMLAHWGQRS